MEIVLSILVLAAFALLAGAAWLWRKGGARKQARLTHLRDAWARRLLEHDRIRLHTSLEPGFACGIATVEIVGLDPEDVIKTLFERHRIPIHRVDPQRSAGLQPGARHGRNRRRRWCRA